MFFYPKKIISDLLSSRLWTSNPRLLQNGFVSLVMINFELSKDQNLSTLTQAVDKL